MSDCVDYKKLLTVAAVIDIAVLLFLIRYRDLTLGLNYDTLTAAGTVAAVTWLSWSVFRSWLWKLPFFQGWLVKIPNLNGNWAGTIQSTWINPETSKVIEPIETTAKITQTLTTIAIDFETNEMASQSVMANIACDEQRRIAEVKYIYQSEPEATVRHRSEMHYGSAKLMVKKNKKSVALKGHYWTDRKTTGTIELKKV